MSRRTPLGGSPATAGTARRYVRQMLVAQHVDEKVTGIVELLTSEVVTNALLHARGAEELSVYVWPTVIRVEVDDPSALLPTRRRAGVDAVSGRGLNIVNALARSWGVEPGPRGKRVWFEVDRDDETEIRLDTASERAASPGSGDGKGHPGTLHVDEEHLAVR
ncbi:MAG: ATP-binding protein [Acidimicrobiia bacterium]